VPPEFMKGIFVVPHYFSDPEKEEHGQFVDLEIRNNMYNMALQRITFCEFSLFAINNQELRVDKIEECKGKDPLFGLSNG
jgi:hypothetical protein